MTYATLTPEGALTVHRGALPDLPALQGVVGGYIEATRLADGAFLITNEDGKAAGLAVNPHATAILREHGARPYPGDFVVGSVAIIGPEDDEGETTPLTEESIATVARLTGLTPE